MKSLLIALLLTSASALAVSILNEVSNETCPGKNVDERNEIVYCKASSSRIVGMAKVGNNLTNAELTSLGIYRFSAADASIVPDADSRTIYFYTRWLVDAAGKIVGIITLEGWTNQEMQSSARFDMRYNLKGELVSISLKPLS